MTGLLPIKRLVYEISVNDRLPLHRFPTITLRGAFGYSLVQIMAREEAVAESDKVEICKRIFFPNGVSSKAAHLNHARPFVLRGYYSRPDDKSFIMEAMIFGNVISAEPLIDKIIHNMCRMGLGDQNLRCDCVKLASEDVVPEAPDLSSGMCAVNFQSPTRIKSGREYLTDSIPFSNLFARLADRLVELVAAHTDNKLDKDFLVDLKRKAGDVDSIVEEAFFHSLVRTSSRTGETYGMGGFTGRMLYAGDLERFADVLAYLPWINVGSSTAFGCGWCDITRR